MSEEASTEELTDEQLDALAAAAGLAVPAAQRTQVYAGARNLRRAAEAMRWPKALNEEPAHIFLPQPVATAQ